jgi:hypothetical protein
MHTHTKFRSQGSTNRKQLTHRHDKTEPRHKALNNHRSEMQKCGAQIFTKQWGGVGHAEEGGEEGLGRGHRGPPHPPPPAVPAAKQQQKPLAI